MRKLIMIFLVCACVLLTTTAAWGTIAPVSANMIVSFDENGHGDVDGTPLQFGKDIPPIGHETLYYILPMFLSGEMGQGDVVVLEPQVVVESASGISDILRFVNVNLPGQGVQARVYVYSDLPEMGELPPYDLADTGIPAVWEPVGGQYPPLPPVYMNEVGLEGGINGVVYQVGDITYKFISDVPEPATICLLGFGALSLLRRKR
jgi:hypothetical protein